MKKILIGILIFILLFTISPYAAKIDGIEIESTVLNGVTMAPLSKIAELMDLDFTAKDGVYSVNNRVDVEVDLYLKLSFVKGQEDKAFLIYSLNGSDPYEEEITLSAKVTFIDGKLYVPFRDVLEVFNARVYWTPEEGAYAYRNNYGREVIVRTDGKIREVVSAPTNFEYITYFDEFFLYIRDGEIIKREVSTSMEENLGKSGKIHVSENKLFVMSGGELWTIDLTTGEKKDILNGVTMVGYTVDDYAWCETEDETFVYDGEGTLIAEIKGEFENSWNYYEGKVYYRDMSGTMYRANPDGTGEEFLIKAALYPEWIGEYIYYTDLAGNYRRFHVETKEDIMVYGLNLEYVMTLSDKYILNFYGENEYYRMYISNPDGSDFAPYGGEGVIAGIKPIIYKDGIVTINQVDNKLYYITKDSAIALTDDKVKSFLGEHDGFLYYTIE